MNRRYSGRDGVDGLFDGCDVLAAAEPLLYSQLRLDKLHELFEFGTFE